MRRGDSFRVARDPLTIFNKRPMELASRIWNLQEFPQLGARDKTPASSG